MNSFVAKLKYKHKYTKARVLEVQTAHGNFHTPVFMPVGTRAGVNNLTIDELKQVRSQIILGGNTYHMLCAPGMDIIHASHGMHDFMGWHGPMLTDSGGFQVFSLSENREICTIDEEGAHFLLPNSKKIIHMTPEMSLATQKTIGADIIMAFDQCTPDDCSLEEARHILKRTNRWLLQSINYHKKNPNSNYNYPQALFGIIQGGVYKELREESASFVVNQELDGIAIGGESIGFDMPKTVEILGWLAKILPEDKPHYTMGVGMYPQDLLDVVKEGADMFDCVAPTRNARHGALYTGEIVPDGDWLRFASPYENGRIQIKKACFKDDDTAVMQTCKCYTCQHYSRAGMHYLFKQKTNIFTALACIHNIHVMNDVCDRMRELIIKNSR